MSSDTPPVESAQDITVRLKPLLGVEPKHYLAGIYSLAVLALLFALLVLPGLTNPGTRVTIESTPAGAAVTYGTKHWGTTPLTVFLPEGTASLTIQKPGFQSDTRDYESKNSVVASLLFPRTDRVEVTLKPTSDTSVANLARAEIGRWALAAPFTSKYRFPPLFTRFSLDARAAGWDDERVRSFLLGFRGAVADPQMYIDYGRALGLWAADAPPPEGLETQFKLWEPLVGSGSGRLALWLLSNQAKPVRDREVAEKSDWFEARLAELTSTFVAASPAGAPTSVKVGGVSFRGVAPSSFLWGSDGSAFPLPTEPPFVVPVPVNVPAFWMAEKEVTQAEFAAFVAAQPRWAPSGRDALVQAGLADADYLRDWLDGRPSAPAEPVVSVSWYAAQAYVAWLNASGQAPAGRQFALPDDFQWEAAARAAGATLLNQGAWEWTASAWYPGQSLVWTGRESVREPEAYARSLKGGTQSAKGSVKAGDRAGWPAAGTTPELGFRLALIGSP